MGWQMHMMARGIDDSKVEERIGVKSVSHETTFEKDTADSTVILQALSLFASEFSSVHQGFKRNNGYRSKYADQFEQWGVDEAFLDVTSKAKTPKKPKPTRS